MVKLIKHGNLNLQSHKSLKDLDFPCHSIDATIGLKDELNNKYIKPNTGIPKSDLGFSLYESSEIDAKISSISVEISNIKLSMTSGEAFAELEEKINDTTTLSQGIKTDVDLIKHKIENGEIGSGSGGSVNFSNFDLKKGTVTSVSPTFDVTVPFEYTLGGNLNVYLNGVLQNNLIEYTEKDSRTISFTSELSSDSIISFSIGTLTKVDTNSTSSSSVTQDAKINVKIGDVLFSKIDSDTVIIQAYKIIKEENNIVKTLKDFNNSDSNNFYFDNENTSFNGVVNINKTFSYIYTETPNQTSAIKEFCTEYIDFSEFINIKEFV